MLNSNSEPEADASSGTPLTPARRVLELAGISKHFGSVIANEDISFDLFEGEILALLGENGAGKTTLMNILFGHYQADSGHIRVFDQVLEKHSPDDALELGVGMVHQHFTLADNLSVLDNIMLGTESLWQVFSRRGKARERLQDIMTDSGLHVDSDALIKDLTVGERQRVEILKALYRNARILILDEPTAVLTPQEVDDLFQLLRSMASKGLSIIIISHKLQEVLSISDRVVVLRQGHVAGEAVTQSVTREQLASMIVGREVQRPSSEIMTAGEQLLAISSITAIDPVSGRKLLDDVSITLSRHQITGIAGVSGNGQSVLAEVLSGLRHPDEGSYCIKDVSVDRATPTKLTQAGLARIPEDRHTHGVIAQMSLWENLLLDETGHSDPWRFGQVLDRRRAKEHADTLIRDFDIRCKNADQPAGLLSGGNIQKLILARNLSRSPDIILANQPTRGLDEGAIAGVHTLLFDARLRGSAILLISEDLDELMRLSDQICVMHNGVLSEPYARADVTLQELGMRMSGAIHNGASVDAS